MPDPTVTDVFNQLVLANGKLEQVEINTSLVTHLNASINQGFNDTVNVLNAISQINIEAVKLLYHQTKQADAMICALENISKNTCEILTQVTIQTELQQHLGDDIKVLRYIAESAHPEAELERKRHAELQADIELCCPPDEPKPACRYKACDRPGTLDEPKLPEIDIEEKDPEKETK